ncbi:TPA: hypothetical protein EYN98_00570 [Candidatus Poribacteria bacterium]|nr:hypothetical protein [Candidatus Poribacteria bacterium]HIB88605.1 hypothetical protein [Candidatus Poribacteria bacterium]HIP10325.1 hypothetical protein [Rhodospirillales bacterium]
MAITTAREGRTELFAICVDLETGKVVTTPKYSRWKNRSQNIRICIATAVHTLRRIIFPRKRTGAKTA